MPNRLKIIGIDPGSRIAGYGVVALDRYEIEYVDHGVLKLNLNSKFEERLVQLRSGLERLIAAHGPAIGVVERVFLGKNADSAFKLGHARGVCIVELAARGISVTEYAAREVKKGVTGNGAATKEQVGHLIERLLKVPKGASQPFDATDALALAFHHAVQMQIAVKMGGRVKELSR